MKTQAKFRKYLKPHRPKQNNKFFHQKAQSIGKTYTLISLQPQLLSIGQIEAARRSIARILKIKKKSDSNFLIRVSPTFPKTSTPLETRMGSGKGSVDRWMASVRNGTIIFELNQIEKSIAKEAFKKAIYKLPGSYKIGFQDAERS